MRKHNDPILTSLYLRPHVWGAWKALARRAGKSANWLLVRLMADTLDHPESVQQWRFPTTTGQDRRATIGVRVDVTLWEAWKALAASTPHETASCLVDHMLSEAMGLEAEWSADRGRPKGTAWMSKEFKPEDEPLEMRTDLTREEKDQILRVLMRQY